MEHKTTKLPYAYVEQTFYHGYVVKIGSTEIVSDIGENQACIMRERINKGVSEWAKK